MKRAWVFLGLVLVGAAPAARAQDTVTVGIGGELSAPLGEQLRVPVFADLTKTNGKKLGSYTMRITWNPSVLSYGGVSDGAFPSPLLRTDSTGNGVLYAAGISAQGLGGQFGLFDLNLTPYLTSSDTVRVSVSELSAAGTFADLLATAKVLTRNAPYCAALGRWGDLDNDGLANSRDALAILSNLVGLPVPGGFDLALGDADGDGRTNSRDALIILSYAVGLDIPGQRVLLVAAGPCTGAVPQFTALPDTVDLVPGQSVVVKVFGKDATGRPTALDNLEWSMADPTVAATDPTGLVTGRAAGTTTLTAAIGPGAQVKVPVVVRARRGTWYVDAQRAKLSTVQLGTQKWPFATPEYAFTVVSEGDTIRIAPGNVDYEFTGGGCSIECFYLGPPGMTAGVVVIGDTLADGTRPVLRAAGAMKAFEWDGGQHAELRNLVLEGFQFGAYLGGLKALVVSNVDYQDPLNSGGSAVYANGYVDTLRILASHFAADTLSGVMDGIYVGSGARYVEIHNTTVDHMYAGFEGYDVDSLDVLQSAFNHGGYGGIELHGWTVPVSARISQSRFLDNYYEAIYVDGARHVGLDHNYIYEKDDDAIQVYGIGGGCCLGAPSRGAARSAGLSRSTMQTATGTSFTMLGDSIKFRADDWDWMDVEDLDSARIDGLWLENPADTALYQYGYLYANYATITNSKLLNLYNQGIDFEGRELVVDNTQFTGCAVCDWNGAYGLEAYSYNDSGPRLTVTNSSFFNMRYGIYASYANTAAGPMVVANTAFDSLATALYLYGDSLAIRDNVFSNIRDYALQGHPSYTTTHPFVEAQILRNQVTCAVVSGYASFGLYQYDAPARFENNAVRNCRIGLYAYNYSYPTAAVTFLGDTVMPDSATSDREGIRVDGKWQAAISGSRVTGGYYGVRLTTTDAAVTAAIDSNVVTGTGYIGVDLSGAAGPAVGKYNNIHDNAQYGIYGGYGGLSNSFTDGRLVGNGTYAIYNPGNPVFDATNNWWGQNTGPHTAGADSVSGNVNTTPYLTADPGGVSVPLAPPIAGAIAGAAPRVSPLAARPAAPAGLGATQPRRPDDATAAQRQEEQAQRRAAKEAARAEHERQQPSPARHRQ